MYWREVTWKQESICEILRVQVRAGRTDGAVDGAIEEAGLGDWPLREVREREQRRGPQGFGSTACMRMALFTEVGKWGRNRLLGEVN